MKSRVSVKGKGKFVVILKKMINSGGTAWNNDCCDSWCASECDTYFKVCLTAFPRPTSISNCMSGVQTSRKLGGNTFAKDYKVERPFNIKTQDFGVFIEAWDGDSSSDKVIDKHSATITAIPTYNGTVITSNTISLTGRRNASKTTLEIQYQLYCDRFYYGPTCGIYCKYSDDINGHYFCNDNGTKVCLENWYGNNCTLWCFPRNSSSDEHYSCLSNSSIKCDPGWYGKNCTTYCWPKNNQYSNYSCDNNGTKICAAFWYGTMCNAFCKPGGVGHYRCDNATGTKVCHEDWYGASCTSYCVATNNDSTGHYSCDPGNGTKVCHKDWYGANCNLSCSSNQSLHQISCNSTDTIKSCAKFAVMCGNSLVSTTPMPTSSIIPKTNFSVFTTKLINLSVLISMSTIVNTRPTISNVSSTLYVQPTMTALNESTDMNTTKSTGKQTRQSEAWKYVSVSLGIVAFLVITTVMLIKFMRARIRRRIGMCDQDEKKEEPPHLEDSYAVTLKQVRGQRMSIQSKDGFTIPPETPECFQIKDPSTRLLPEDSSLNRGIN
ncbi:protein jagged-1-like [Actinia tenebrosa]|uniref:Delta-like protein n=1 Tax=Actinia tenebrosa TaxID=6105 RepID=A0A6P8HIL0_ACTTE|nr:protein jagged-1-like [Actinia tenebrosa]